MKASRIILSYMKANGITYRDVASRTGRSFQNVWNILNGKDGNKASGTKGRREPNYKTVVEICDAIGLKIEIRPTGEPHDPQALIKAAELQYVPFSTVQRLLEASGYAVTFSGKNFPPKTHNN